MQDSNVVAAADLSLCHWQMIIDHWCLLLCGEKADVVSTGARQASLQGTTTRQSFPSQTTIDDDDDGQAMCRWCTVRVTYYIGGGGGVQFSLNTHDNGTGGR